MHTSAENTGAPSPIVFGTGLLALDVILSADPTQPPRLAAGGTCGNVLAALAYLGWEAYPIGRMGSDVASEVVRADLQRSGVELEFASQPPTAATPVIVQHNRIKADGTPTHRFFLACPACGAWFPSYRAVTQETARAVAEAVSAAAYGGFAPRVFFFDRTSRGALLLAALFAELGALVVFEPSGVGDPALFEEALAVAHVIKYSRERLPELAERRWARTSLRSPRLEIETRGADGLRYRSTGLASAAWCHLPAVAAPVLRDAAGAGDWCTAGLLAVLCREGDAGAKSFDEARLTRALRYGQAAAAIACGYEGARGLMETLHPGAFAQAASQLLSRHTTSADSGVRGPNENHLGDCDAVVRGASAAPLSGEPHARWTDAALHAAVAPRRPATSEAEWPDLARAVLTRAGRADDAQSRSTLCRACV